MPSRVAEYPKLPDSKNAEASRIEKSMIQEGQLPQDQLPRPVYAIGGRRLKQYPLPIVRDPKIRSIMLAGKKSTASYPVQNRSSIAPVDVDAGVNAVDVVPFDSNTMSSVLTFEPKDTRNVSRPYLVETD